MEELDKNIKLQKEHIDKLEINKFKDLSIVQIIEEYQKLIDLYWYKISIILENAKIK